jgi:hypothetical protein
MGHMDEEEFATEMLTSLKVDGERDEDRVRPMIVSQNLMSYADSGA